MPIKFLDKEIIQAVKKRARKIFYSMYIDCETVHGEQLAPVYFTEYNTVNNSPPVYFTDYNTVNIFLQV